MEEVVISFIKIKEKPSLMRYDVAFGFKLKREKV